MFYLYLLAVIKISNYYFLPAYKFTPPRISHIFVKRLMGEGNIFTYNITMRGGGFGLRMS